MDIRIKAVQTTGRLELCDANDELIVENGVVASVTMYGPGSKQYATAQSRQQNRMIDKLKSKGKTDQTAEQKAAETAEFLTDITVGFEGVEYDGKEGRALALAVYSDITIGFIADQVSKFVGEWSNFTKQSVNS